MKTPINDLYNALIRKIEEHNAAYYNGTPKIEDSEFDQMMRELKAMELSPEVVRSSNSPTCRVGGVISSAFQKVAHVTPMLSIDNVFDDDDLKAKMDRVSKTICDEHKVEAVSWSVEPKVDGLSLDLHYHKNDGLIRALTRGNGEEGEDVTENAKTIRNLPLFIPPPMFVDWMHVRGEVFMLWEDFHELNRHPEIVGDKPMSNPRNAAVGALRLLNSKQSAQRRLSFMPYSVETWCQKSGKNAFLDFQANVLDWLHFCGFMNLQPRWFCRGTDEVLDRVKEFGIIKKSLPFPTDGAVIKVNKVRWRATVGHHAKAPRWAWAYKYEPERGETKLKSITMQVGRTGTICPVAELDPIELSGSVISRATLHNAQQISKLDIRVGDMVMVEKSGEVIPCVLGPVLSKRTGAEQVFEFPSKCPCCHYPIEQSVLADGKIGADWFCINSDCHDQVLGRLIYWCQRDVMDIEDMGDSTIERLIDSGALRTVVDFYRLSTNTLVEAVGAITATKLNERIQASKQNGMEKVLVGLGIESIGHTISRRLAKCFKDLRALQRASQADLSKVKDLWASHIDNLIMWFEQPTNSRLLDELELAGVSLKSSTYSDIPAGGKLDRMTFVFTGEIPIERDEAIKMVEMAGGRATGSVSKKTTHLVVGVDAGVNKSAKARELGTVKILNYAEFLTMLGLEER